MLKEPSKCCNTPPPPLLPHHPRPPCIIWEIHIGLCSVNSYNMAPYCLFTNISPQCLKLTKHVWTKNHRSRVNLYCILRSVPCRISLRDMGPIDVLCAFLKNKRGTIWLILNDIVSFIHYIDLFLVYLSRSIY